MSDDNQPQVNPLTTELLAVLAKQLAKTAQEQRDTLAAELASSIPNGSKITARDPRNNLALGTVSKSDPAPVGYVKNRDVFEAWVREQHPDELTSEVTFGPTEEVAAVLAEHAPHLLGVQEGVIPKWLEDNALGLTAKHDDVPGTGRMFPDGVVSVRPNTNAIAVINEMLASSPIRMQLEAGE